MNIPLSWIKQYVNLNCTVNEFEHEMTMTGTKVESIVRRGSELSGIVVGKIISISKHENADKLVVTKIDVNQQLPLQIVTGATNVFEGALVPVALDGATLANNIKIKAGEIRGVASCGMLCSIEELGYTKNDYPEAPENGIYIFKEEVEVGADVRQVLELCDDVAEFEITSNRPDCYSVLGIAREAAATFNLPFNMPQTSLKQTAEGNINELIQVEIKNPELCPRYVAKVIKNVKIEPSPQWLRHRLTMCGVRPINNIVDITNYVMLEFGQPMHAFDIDNVAQRKIIVRNATQDEKFITLDGIERTLDESILVISDCEKSLAIAGVMGGENSKVTENASAILFESANFNGANIRKTSKKLGLRTDSSGKFEKGIDPNVALLAINRAAQLVEMLNCGEVVEGVVDCYPKRCEPITVEFSSDRVNALLGTNISMEQMEEYLGRVEIKSENGIACIPTFRPDITEEADIAEEVARFYGYNNIEETLSSKNPTVGKKSYIQIMEDIVKQTMVSCGLCEAMHYSFESKKVFNKLCLESNDILRNTVNIINPLGEDFSIMRTTTLNGMLSSLSTNYNRRNEEAVLFEVGKVYLPKALPLTELPKEVLTLTIGTYGKKDFYVLKGIVEQLFNNLGVLAEYIPNKTISYMHSGRTATILVGNEDVGLLGEIHPTVAQNYEIYNADERVYVAVINLEAIFKMASLERKYKPLPKYPRIVRDIAMLVETNVIHKDIEKIIKENSGQFLEDILLFDVYMGKQIKEGYKSVAYSISFRAENRTLTDDEVNLCMNKILESLQEKLGASIRK